jgi:hypothetical protein
VPDRFHVYTNDGADHEPGERADHSDRGSGDQEDPNALELARALDQRGGIEVLVEGIAP